jgi:hypothetical protein
MKIVQIKEDLTTDEIMEMIGLAKFYGTEGILALVRKQQEHLERLAGEIRLLKDDGGYERFWDKPAQAEGA